MIDDHDRWRAYERMCRRTWASTPGQAMDDPEQRGIHLAVAMPSEAGEAAEILKKAHRRRRDCQLTLKEREHLMHELGDVLWAVASTAVWLGWNLDLVRRANEVKMLERHPSLVYETIRDEVRLGPDELGSKPEERE